LFYFSKSCDILYINIGCSFKFILKVGDEENAENPLAPRHSTPRHTKLHYATRRKSVQKFNKDLNALRRYSFVPCYPTTRHTTWDDVCSIQPSRLFSKRVEACCPPSLLLQPRSRDFDTGSQVLPLDRKHPLLTI
jgi:hypothetical protein